MANQYLMSAVKGGSVISWTANGAPDFTGAQSGFSPSLLSNITLVTTIPGSAANGNFFLGPQGSPGPTGSIGTPGTAGPQGATGPAGSANAISAIASDVLATGPGVANATVVALRGNAISTNVPTAGQALSYVASGVNKWTPQYGHGPVINVKDFGAHGDGVADDTTAIQNILNILPSFIDPITGRGDGGATLYFPAGTYNISAELTIPELSGLFGTPLLIEGAGRQVTQIVQTTINNGFGQHMAWNATGISYIVLRDITFVNSATHAILSNTMNNVWRPNTTYTLNQVIMLPGPSNRLLKCTTPGTSGFYTPYHQLWAGVPSNPSSNPFGETPDPTVIITGTPAAQYTTFAVSIAVTGIPGSGLQVDYTLDGVSFLGPLSVSGTSVVLGATGLTANFQAGQTYTAGVLYAAPPNSTGFSIIVGDVVQDGTAQWTIIDGGCGFLNENGGIISIERCDFLSWMVAIMFDSTETSTVNDCSCLGANGIWIGNANERNNGNTAPAQVGSSTNGIYCSNLNLGTSIGIAIVDSGGSTHTFENVIIEGNINQVSTVSHPSGSGPLITFTNSYKTINGFYSVIVQITSNGNQSSAGFKFSLDAGNTYTTGLTAGTNVALGSSGLTITFPTGSYTTSDTYTALTLGGHWNYNGWIVGADHVRISGLLGEGCTDGFNVGSSAPFTGRVIAPNSNIVIDTSLIDPSGGNGYALYGGPLYATAFQFLTIRNSWILWSGSFGSSFLSLGNGLKIEDCLVFNSPTLFDTFPPPNFTWMNSETNSFGLGCMPTGSLNAGMAINAPFALQSKNDAAQEQGFSGGLNNNYASLHASVIEITNPNAAFTITGIAGGTEGQIIELHNLSGQQMTIAHKNTNSLFGNRFICPNNVDLVLPVPAPGNFTSVQIKYSVSQLAWFVVSYTPPAFFAGATGGAYLQGPTGYLSFGTGPAQVGNIRASNNTTIVSARNAANSLDIPVLKTDTSNDILIGDESITNSVVIEAFGNIELASAAGDFVFEPGAGSVQYWCNNIGWVQGFGNVSINFIGAQTSDIPANSFTIQGESAFPSAATNRTGGALQLFGGSGASGAPAGNVQVNAAATFNQSGITTANLGPTGPYSTSGILNANTIGMVMAYRSVGADIPVIQVAPQQIEFGDTTLANSNVYVEGYTVTLDSNLNLVYGNTTFENNTTTVGTATFNAGINALGPIAISPSGPTGYIAFGSGPAQTANLRFSANPNYNIPNGHNPLMAIRNVANNADQIVMGTDINNYFYIGDPINTPHAAIITDFASFAYLNSPSSVGLLTNDATFYIYCLAGELYFGGSASTTAGAYLDLLSAATKLHFGTSNTTSATILFDQASSDTATKNLIVQGQNAFSTASTNTVGGQLNLLAGTNSTGPGQPYSTVNINAQPYGAQRVPTASYVFNATGAQATFPAQFQIPMTGQNVAFDMNIYFQALGAGGVRAIISAPSGAFVTAQYQGAVGATAVTDAFMMTGATNGPYATAVGTGVYGNTVNPNAINGITIQGSISCAAGCTGPVSIGIQPWVTQHTMMVLPGSNTFIYPST